MKWQHNRRNSKTVLTLAPFITTIVVVLIFGLLFHLSTKNSPVAAPANVSASPTPTPAREHRAKLMAVGDMLIHDDVYEDFRIGTTDTFDFRPAFIDVKPILQWGDFNIVNQETILGGVELGLSGLYVANSPIELGDAFIDAGFNIIQLANNHAYDRGMAGMTNTLNFWKAHSNQVITSGVFDSQTARDEVRIIDRQGIKLAFLAYTYGSNRGNGANSFNLNLTNRDLIKNDVAKAKSLADVVVVGLHWGVEKVREPNADQKSLAQFLADNGVDVIYGTHPHVLQAPQWLTRPDGKKTFVMYSLGNFLSIHTEDPLYTLTGAIMGLEIVKQPDTTILLEKPFAVLTWNYFTQTETDFKVMPFDTVTPADFWWGNWATHQPAMEDFIRQKIPDLRIMGLSDFVD